MLVTLLGKSESILKSPSVSTILLTEEKTTFFLKRPLVTKKILEISKRLIFSLFQKRIC